LASILFCPRQPLIHDSHPPTEAKFGVSPRYQASNIMPVKYTVKDLNPINIDGVVCRFTLNDATGGFGAVFDGGLAVDTLQPLLSHPEI